MATFLPAMEHTMTFCLNVLYRLSFFFSISVRSTYNIAKSMDSRVILTLLFTGYFLPIHFLHSTNNKFHTKMNKNPNIIHFCQTDIQYCNDKRTLNLVKMPLIHCYNWLMQDSWSEKLHRNFRMIVYLAFCIFSTQLFVSKLIIMVRHYRNWFMQNS